MVAGETASVSRLSSSVTSPSSLPAIARFLPFYYGWFVVAIAMLAAFIGSGLNNVNMGVIFKPMSDDLGWGRSLMAGAVAVGTIVGGIFTPLAGRYADKFGPRVIMPLGALLMGLLALALALVTEPWQFYLAYVPARAISHGMLIGVVPITAVANWFYRQRPRALGLVTMAVPLGASGMALAYQLLINEYGWRATFLTLAILLLTLVVVPTALFLRRQPEDFGLLPDGASAPEPTNDSPGPNSAVDATGEVSWTLQEAMRTPSLWLIAICLGLGTLASGGIAFNMAAYFTDADFDPTVAAGTLSVFALAGAVGSGLWGFLAERYSIRVISVGTFGVSAISLALLLVANHPVTAYIFAALFGLTARGEAAMGPILVSHYFGRRSFGSISGIVTPINMLGLGLGPVAAAAVYDTTGSYQGIILFFIGAFIVASLLMILAKKPTHPTVGPRPQYQTG
ncbi:MAG: MFS transporter [Chloroflexota bacterium]